MLLHLLPIEELLVELLIGGRHGLRRVSLFVALTAHVGQTAS
jgi:hypothetical protein